MEPLFVITDTIEVSRKAKDQGEKRGPTIQVTLQHQRSNTVNISYKIQPGHVTHELYTIDICIIHVNMHVHVLCTCA